MNDISAFPKRQADALRLTGGWRIPDDPMKMLLAIAERDRECMRRGKQPRFSLGLLVAVYLEMQAEAKSAEPEGDKQ